MTEQASTRGYETSDAPPWLVAALAIGSAVFILSTPLLMQALNPIVEIAAKPTQRPPAPRLQVDAKSDLANIRRDEQAQLDALEWINRDQNIVRIPVAQAMHLIAQRGLPGWPRGTAKLSNPPAR